MNRRQSEARTIAKRAHIQVKKNPSQQEHMTLTMNEWNRPPYGCQGLFSARFLLQKRKGTGWGWLKQSPEARGSVRAVGWIKIQVQGRPNSFIGCLKPMPRLIAKQVPDFMSKTDWAGVKAEAQRYESYYIYIRVVDPGPGQGATRRKESIYWALTI